MANPKATSPNVRQEPLSKAALARVAHLHKDVKLLATKVERENLSLAKFVHTMILKIGSPDCGPKDVMAADSVLTYLRRRDIDTKWVIEFFERHANVVYMRRTGGTFRRDTRATPRAGAGSAIDVGRLLNELEEWLEPQVGRRRSGTAQTLFDQSTKAQTMRASKFAK